MIAELGVGVVTHRSVAAAAGVPLGSTTYYFKDLDQLLSAALVRAAQTHLADVQAWASELDDGCDLPARLADWVIERSAGPKRDRLKVEMELVVAARRHPSLRPLFTAWVEELHTALSRFTDPLTARAVTATVGGLLVQALLSELPPDRRALEALLGRVLEKPPPGVFTPVRDHAARPV